MGCCSPEYRKVINAKEEEINKRDNNSLPLFVKIISIFITVGALIAASIIK